MTILSQFIFLELKTYICPYLVEELPNGMNQIKMKSTNLLFYLHVFPIVSSYGKTMYWSPIS